jgi:hypothetical protein
VFQSLAARSKFTELSESPFGLSAAQKLLTQVPLTLSEASPGSDPGDETSGPSVFYLRIPITNFEMLINNIFNPSFGLTISYKLSVQRMFYRENRF